VRELAAMKRRPETIKYSDSISKELKQLLQRMLEPDPNRRINLNDILTVEWMEKKKIPSN
jgi:serine/threonine protein kinase